MVRKQDRKEGPPRPEDNDQSSTRNRVEGEEDDRKQRDGGVRGREGVSRAFYNKMSAQTQTEDRLCLKCGTLKTRPSTLRSISVPSRRNKVWDETISYRHSTPTEEEESTTGLLTLWEEIHTRTSHQSNGFPPNTDLY